MFETNNFMFSFQRFFFSHFDWRRIKKQKAEKKNLKSAFISIMSIVFVVPVFLNSKEKLLKTEWNSLENTRKVVNS